MRGFQPGAFQSNAFQQDTGTPVVTASNSGGYSLGHYPKRRTEEDLRKERIRLGIIPAPVEKIVARVAARAVKEAPQGIDPLQLIEQEQQKLQARLEAKLAKEQIEYQHRYMQLVGIQIALALEAERVKQEDEEAQIVHLLFEM